MNAKEKPDILCIRYLEISNDFLIDIFILFGSNCMVVLWIEYS